LGSGSDALTVKQLAALSKPARNDLLRNAWQCIAWLQVETHVLSMIIGCSLTPIPLLHQACSVVQV